MKWICHFNNDHEKFLHSWTLQLVEAEAHFIPPSGSFHQTENSDSI